MGSDDGTVYLLQGDGEWVSPAPAADVIFDALVDAGDLSADDIDELAAYVDIDELARVVDGKGDALTFTVEGHDVTVTSDGDVRVA